MNPDARIRMIARLLVGLEVEREKRFKTLAERDQSASKQHQIESFYTVGVEVYELLREEGGAAALARLPGLVETARTVRA